MARIASLLLLPLVWLQEAHGHALWQQVVQAEKTPGSESNAIATIFTFAENPGIAQVEAERMATKAHDKGVYTYIKGADDEFYPLTQVNPRIAGKFLVSDLPDAGTSYMLESVYFSGLYGHGDEKPKNNVFYTSAPNYGIKSIQEVTKLSKNKLRLVLVDVERAVDYNVGGFYESICKGTDMVCVAAEAVFGDEKLFNATVKVINGESGAEIDTQYTNVGGLAYFSFPKTMTSRIFGKVSHGVATPGSVTRDGQGYDDTNYIATTVMELTPNYPQYPDDADTTATTLVATMDTYPDAKVNGASPKGYVYMSFHDNGHVTIEINASNLSRSCTVSNTVKNGCGVHVHAGKTCDEADLVEGHYYPKTLPDDPWADVRYDSDEAGSSRSRTVLKEGSYGADDTVGRAVVIHDPDGGRIGCGLLQYTSNTLVATIDKYPDAKIDGKSPQGSVFMSFDDNDNVAIKINANNLSPKCSESNTNKNGCGVHVHLGRTCDDADLVEGHYYPRNVADDPWKNVRYSSNAVGLSTSSAMMKGNGYGAADNVGRAMVLHDTDGGRIGCGLLQYTIDEDVKDVVEEALSEIVGSGSQTTPSTASNNENSGGSELSTRDSLVLFGAVLLASFLGGLISAKLVGRFSSPRYGPAAATETATESSNFVV